MRGGSQVHALAPEHGLRQVLVEIGAAVPTRALYLVDRDHDDPAAYTTWLETACPRLAHLTTNRQAVSS